MIISMPSEADKYSRDADTVFVHQHIRAANPGVEIMVELDSPATMSFLSRPTRCVLLPPNQPKVDYAHLFPWVALTMKPLSPRSGGGGPLSPCR